MKSSVRRVRITSTPGDFLKQLLESKRDVEHELGLRDAFALRARIVTAVSGIDDDPRNTQSELTRHRESARHIPGRRVRRRRRRGVHGDESTGVAVVVAGIGTRGGSGGGGATTSYNRRACGDDDQHRAAA